MGEGKMILAAVCQESFSNISIKYSSVETMPVKFFEIQFCLSAKVCFFHFGNVSRYSHLLEPGSLDSRVLRRNTFGIM